MSSGLFGCEVIWFDVRKNREEIMKRRLNKYNMSHWQNHVMVETAVKIWQLLRNMLEHVATRRLGDILRSWSQYYPGQTTHLHYHHLAQNKLISTNQCIMIEKTNKPNDNGAKYSLYSNHKNENPVSTNQQLEKYTHKEFCKIWLNSRTNELKTEKM